MGVELLTVAKLSRFGLGVMAIGIFAWAIVPGLVAREIAPASWQWPERMAARTPDLPAGKPGSA